LGVSASSGSRACIGRGTSFTRIFGNPVVAIGELDCDISTGISPTFDANDGNIIFRRDAVVADGAIIAGSIKAHGRLLVGAGALVAGNVIARGDVVLGAAARVDGHAFSEGFLHVGRGARVGTGRASKTAYGATGLTLDEGAIVHGWATTDGVGRIA
jgi:predicted acyltransferase (DUF342 family)